MPYTHATMMKRNLRDIEYMARNTNALITDESPVMPWESDLVSRAATHLFSVHRYEQNKSRSFGASDYGGCGTFFGLTKDPTKRACVLERKIQNAQAKCAKGKSKQCDKVAKFEAELMTLTGGGLTPAAGTPADFYYQQALMAQSAALTSQPQTDWLQLATYGAVVMVVILLVNEYT